MTRTEVAQTAPHYTENGDWWPVGITKIEKGDDQ